MIISPTLYQGLDSPDSPFFSNHVRKSIDTYIHVCAICRCIHAYSFSKIDESIETQQSQDHFSKIFAFRLFSSILGGF